MHPLPSLIDIYPPEIRERILALPDPRLATDQQKRIAAIVEDHDVCKASRHVTKKWKTFDNPEDARAWLENFWIFIERAAALPDAQPYGSKLRENGPAEFPYQTQEMNEALVSATGHAQKLQRVMHYIAPSIAPDIPIEESRALIEQLEKVIAACCMGSFKLTTRNAGKPVFPPPSPQAKKNNWSNWILQQLATLAETYLGDRHLTFTLQVHRTLLNFNEPISPNSARRIIGMKTHLADPL